MTKLTLTLLILLSFNAQADNLPDFLLDPISIHNQSLEHSLKQILKGTVKDVVVEKGFNPIINVKNLSGYSQDVVEFLVKKTNSTYEYKNNVLFVSPIKQLAAKQLNINEQANLNKLPFSKKEINEDLAGQKENIKEQIQPVKILVKNANKIEVNNVVEIPVVTIKSGDLVSYTLKEYLEKNGYKLYWNASHSIEAQKEISYFGNLQEAVNKYLKDFQLTGWIVEDEKSIYVN